MEHVIELNMYSATPAQVRLGTEESYGYETLRLVRGEGWQDLEIIVSFTPARNNRAINVLVDSNDTVKVPPEFTSKFGTRNIVVIGKADGKQLVSCDIIAYIEEHATTDDVEPAEATPDLVYQILAAANDAKKIAKSVREDADSGAFQGPPGIDYKFGNGLALDRENNTLYVDTAKGAEKDNTRPITAAAVYTEIGNINVLLEMI